MWKEQSLAVPKNNEEKLIDAVAVQMWKRVKDELKGLVHQIIDVITSLLTRH